MEIGKPVREFIVEPKKDPIRREEPAPAPAREKEKVEEREKVGV